MSSLLLCTNSAQNWIFPPSQLGIEPIQLPSSTILWGFLAPEPKTPSNLVHPFNSPPQTPNQKNISQQKNTVAALKVLYFPRSSKSTLSNSFAPSYPPPFTTSYLPLIPPTLSLHLIPYPSFNTLSLHSIIYPSIQCLILHMLCFLINK